MALRDLVRLDAWSSLNFKTAMDHPDRMAPSWVPREQLRRLTSYKLRAAYLEQTARQYFGVELDDKDRKAHREYGEPSLLVHRVVAGVLGEDMAIVVDEADTELGDAPRLPEEPEDPGPEASDIERASYDAQKRVWQARAREVVEQWEADWAAQPGLQAHQEWLRGWADKELFTQRVWECEQQVVGLADGVYVLAWSALAGRPTVRIYDPGFYFPVLDDAAEMRGFPTRIHIAYETDEDDDGVADHVRRITWELGPIFPATDFEGVPVVDDNGLVLREGDRLDSEGRITRRYPWSEEDSATTCYLTDATWPFDALGDRKVDDFDASKARYAIGEDGNELRKLDLRIDFLPIIHVPNTPASQEHFGRSVLDRPAQLLDDIAETDSDVQKAAALAGTPMLALAGKEKPPTGSIEVEPGAVWWLGEGGSLGAIDLSTPVTVLRDLVDNLLERLFTNVQVPGPLLGKPDDDVRSGIHLKLRFSPFAQLVGVLRLVRDPKYALMLKMVTRLAQTGGALEPGPTPTARLRFGQFLPEDLAGLIELVVKLVGAKVISRATGLRLLVEAGIDVADIGEEMDAVAATDFVGARELLDAAGDDGAVRQYLGLAGDGPNPEAPALDIPNPPIER